MSVKRKEGYEVRIILIEATERILPSFWKSKREFEKWKVKKILQVRAELRQMAKANLLKMAFR